MSKKASMSFAQILILIISTFAFAYLVYSTSESVEAQTAAAATGLENFLCCKIKNGTDCQYRPQTECDLNLRNSPTECKNTDFCKEGCCYSSRTGWCNEKTPKRVCENEGGAWTAEEACNIPQCQRGCCILGSNALWAYPGECSAKARAFGIQPDFRTDVASEVECIFLTEKDVEGACVYEEDFIKTCKFTTQESCERMRGYFYKNVFCSDSGLETNCEAHEHASCLEGKESVYWFDSCGNKENIKEECSIFVGTICGQVEGEYKCKSIDCKAKDGKNRKNGESWCSYDGTIGNGRDVAGSRHVRHVCFMGEERIEPCADYRNEICVQDDADIGNGKKFSEAACRVNNWRSCLEYSISDDAGERSEKCNENPDCMTKGVNVNDFNFDICVPRYPPGFDLTNEAGGEDANAVCGIASQTCTVIYIKDWKGKCKCEMNCDCRKEGFTNQMNELCTTMGDCGAYVNIAGEYTTDGYTIKSGSRLSQSYLNSLKQYALPKPGQKPAEPGNLSFLRGAGILKEAGGGGSNTLRNVGLGITVIQIIPGVVGALAGAPVIGDIGVSVGRALQPYQKLPYSGKGPVEFVKTPAGKAFSNALATATAVLAVASILQAINPDMNLGTALAIGGAVTAAVYLLAGKGTAGMAALRVLGWIGLGFAIFELIIGAGKVCKKVQVTYTCLPWQSPTGGKDCDKCNPQSPFDTPCSTYRCKSLGQTCEIMNQGTEHELCTDVSPKDVTSPRISPLLGTITTGYKYFNIKDNGFEVTDLNGKCIPEFTNVLFGIKTDKLSQCKVGTSALQTYDEMGEFFDGSNLFLKNHTSILNLPSPELLKYQYNLTDAEIKSLSEVKLYVKCKSVTGKTNDAAYVIKTCVKPGPDLTAPYIEKIEPANGAYVSYSATEQYLKLWTNEPANCKWSAGDNSYNDMENSMECKTDFEDREFWGWTCNTTLTGLDENTKFYIKCRDLAENNNTMQSYLYELERSESELKIDEIKPANGEEIISGLESVNITIEAKTSGGAEQGKAICEWQEVNRGWSDFFTETDSSKHSSSKLYLAGGSYKFNVKCKDVAGNEAENFTEFSIRVDREAPKITRVYYDGNLKIITDENAVCGYSFTDSKCRFDMENSTQAELMSGEGKEHSADWQTENTYYIKCKDSYGREPGECSMIVRPYDVI